MIRLKYESFVLYHVIFCVCQKAPVDSLLPSTQLYLSWNSRLFNETYVSCVICQFLAALLPCSLMRIISVHLCLEEYCLLLLSFSTTSVYYNSLYYRDESVAGERGWSLQCSVEWEARATLPLSQSRSATKSLVKTKTSLSCGCWNTTFRFI